MCYGMNTPLPLVVSAQFIIILDRAIKMHLEWKGRQIDIVMFDYSDYT